MPRPPLSVTLICFNEEARIEDAIRSVSSWADEVLVVDSGSTDRTAEIAAALGARVLRNPWPGYGQQKNFAQSNARHDWVLNLDADEVVPPELAREIQTRLEGAEQEGIRGFRMPRKTYYLGQWIRHGGWYPNQLVRLADRRFAAWSEPQVHEALEVRGMVGELRNPLHHDAFSCIRDQVLTNLRFSQLGSEDLKRAGHTASLIRLLLKPSGKFLETYILKRGFLDGWAGLIISINASHSMFLKYAYLFEPLIRSRSGAKEAGK